MPSTKPLSHLATLISLCKRRGFIFQSSEIYGGLNSCWDYGPLGANFKLNVKLAWWKSMVRRPDVVGLDASILMHPTVWKASGHVDTFTDPLVDCKECKNRFRQDQELEKGFLKTETLERDSLEKNPTEKGPPKKDSLKKSSLKRDGMVTCPQCGSTNVTEARNFNLMFKTFMGPVEDEGSVVYMRPETAQGIFVNFDNVRVSLRKKIPFGIAQIGKSFRNEITPGNFTFRTREFEQMEMQYFVKPGSDTDWFEKWKDIRWNFYKNMGFKEDQLRFHPHQESELAHYAKMAFDIEYKFPFGWNEIEGIHNRSDFDLSQHQKFSGKKLEYFDDATKEKYTPYVIETAAGCDRLTLALLCHAYREEIPAEREPRIVLGLQPALAPYKAAILPLSKKEPLQELAHKVFEDLSHHWEVDYDEAGSIGKRYRRQDEIGTPFCLTIDFDSMDDQKATVRNRDTMGQERVAMENLKSYIRDQLQDQGLTTDGMSQTAQTIQTNQSTQSTKQPSCGSHIEN